MTERLSREQAGAARRSLSAVATDLAQTAQQIARAKGSEWLAAMRARPRAVPPYKQPTTWRGRLLWVALAPALFVFCFIYGFFFALTAPYLIIQFSFPILLLALLAVWALPDERRAPTRFMRILLSGYILSLSLWPSYLALSLPGLPWITPARLFGMPLAFLLLVSLSTSRRFRHQLWTILNAHPLIWKTMAIFTATQFITIPFSGNLPATINKVLIQQVNWTTVFVFSAYMFSAKGRIPKYISLICCAIVPIFAISHIEYGNQGLLWAGHVPSFLSIENLDKILSPEFRPGTNEYRAKATFSTALGLAQFMSVLTPFFLMNFLQKSKPISKLISVGCIAIIYMSIEYSGSRLGLVGMLWSLLMYVFILAFMRWRTQRTDLIAPAIFYSYPFFFTVVMLASFTIQPVHDAVWGGGAHQGSNQARIDQIGMALPQALKNPIGYGAGQSGPAMGYGEGEFVTIDNYLISLTLDYGFVGLVSYLVLFLGASAIAFRYAVLYASESKDSEARYLIPLGVSASAFIVIKFVFSQIENDPLLFLILGMITALTARLKREREAMGLPLYTAPKSPSGKHPVAEQARGAH